MAEQLSTIYLRLRKDGWTGLAGTTFRALGDLAFTLDFVDGKDPVSGEIISKALPWFEISAKAEVIGHPMQLGVSSCCFQGAGTTYLAALGALLDDIDSKGKHHCVWQEKISMTPEQAADYLDEHPLFGMLMATTCRLQKRTFQHPTDGEWECHSVEAGPWRFPAIGTDPFLKLSANSAEELRRKLAERVWLAYGNQTYLYPTEVLKKAHNVLLQTNAYNWMHILFSENGRILCGVELTPAHRQNDVAVQMHLISERAGISADSMEELLIGLAAVIERMTLRPAGGGIP